MPPYGEYKPERDGEKPQPSPPPPPVGRPLKELSDLLEALTDKGLDITGKVFGIPVELHLQIPK